MTVYFGIKYYAPDPCRLAEEITRYQFFLQCKQDILQGRLPVPFELAVELFALAVQSELGDYDPQRHQDNYVGEFQFLPANQSYELERRVALFHRSLQGQVPATAELNFLERVKWLDLYGCDRHPIQYDDEQSGQLYCGSSAMDSAGAREEDEYALGLTPSGVSVLRNKLKVAHYVWQRIVKTKCQGRCFLMDVMGNLAGAAVAASSNNNAASTTRQRFGFRLADKEASRRLRLSLEQHKSFYHLIENSPTLNQLAAAAAHQRSQRHRPLSQRFRHSIRSAIQSSSSAQLIQQQQQLTTLQRQHHHQQQQQRMQLRSSIKSESRQPPAVVRMPSRRYGADTRQTSQQYQPTATSGLPSAAPGMQQHAHTMLERQRQQALMMMNQLNQAGQSHGNSMAAAAAKSQTLKPMSSKQAAANREKNQYYHQMMLAMMANQQQQQPNILGPGRHALHEQANIYKASSVINGIHQLASRPAREQSVMQQLFNTRPQYQSRGHESPRSTKSAIAPSSALKLASKKLAKQQLLYGTRAADVQPLLALDPIQNQQQQQQQMYSNYYGISAAYNVNSCASANQSPRSARSMRLSGASRHKSKSTSENLHLLHDAANFLQPSGNNNKMLLATATQLMQQQLMQRPPPPNYNGNTRPLEPKYSDNESELSKVSAQKRQHSNNRKRATFALTNEQANILLSAQSELAVKSKRRDPIAAVATEPNDHDDDDDYCCSRSDCSSLEGGPTRRGPPVQSKQQQPTKAAIIGDHRDWDSIRRRHENFSQGKAFGQLEQSSLARDANNNSPSQLVKNIANKQATPILLSMNFDQSSVNNNKAVQLLNLQRQQLNSSSSTASGQSASSAESVQGAAGQSKSCSESGSSSVSSSPKQQPTQQRRQPAAKTKADSTVSNSTTTSGYYAGSNSTGSASADSDSQQSSSTRTRPAGSGAKIALGSHSAIQSRMSGDRLLIGNQAHLKFAAAEHQSLQPNRQQFYLGDPRNNNNSESKPIMSEPEPWQQQPSSLKYVSFDV